MKLKVSEIFYSAQGEGRFVGVPSVFLRTFGCNFTCITNMKTYHWLRQAVTVMRHGIPALNI